MSRSSRKLQYSLAINEALRQMMEADDSVFLIGQGVKSPWYVGKTADGLLEKFGENRVIDTPVSENAMTGAAVGAAIAGMRSIVVHPRLDFMFYAFDPIINEAANWHYMFGGKSQVPVVVWGIVNRGGEQAAQHSQAIHAVFAHIPGLKVVMPSTPYDAKGLMISAIKDDNPVIYIDDRWLYDIEGNVPEGIYEVPIGKGRIRRNGSDITLVSISYMVEECLKAADELSKEGIRAEIVDLRTAKPLDKEIILNSVSKTGRMIVVDGGWSFCGLAAEILAMVSESGFDSLKTPVVRLTVPECPAPSSRMLEAKYFEMSGHIFNAVKDMVSRSR
ncbi:MAG: alpha-ketoacid dehydrogenase subunit beta [Candidatus Omnitrophica bacterium]|nr:alpha-ketoacid dehydrogenase subunit beta [Candidatus Omnitrophota bacterium]MBU1127569.1 alpha-ketoacid dehydrogenase subunit beta [Candidatus Omnitrophota bacterium]MBU1784617.1 alpha-ketoacid dehydrogenase subunit beta [Candidatus Omnitrophota bacterium]MBU1852405.1 alpha-ketoacid dehydrogenase subunit beta [Candidatus Omnitrophota bacterium]